MSTFDPRIQTENIAFDPAAMVACDGCGRTNPPNRLKCIYCGKALAIAVKNAASIKPTLRKLELWERGFNLIVRERMPQPDVTAAAQFVLLEIEELSAILDAATPLPVARVESETEALIVRDRLSQFGIGCSVVSDSDLAPERPPMRLSSVEFLDDQLGVRDFNTAEQDNIDAADFVLLVPGTISVDRIDSLEKKGRGGKTKVLDESAIAADEMLLDLYIRGDAKGYRIHLAGFDFSCLGEDKGLLAGENMRLLTARLYEFLPNAKLVNDYDAIRHALGRVWEVELRKDSHGFQRSTFGKAKFSSTASSNNLNQFTKYSRLQWHLR